MRSTIVGELWVERITRTKRRQRKFSNDSSVGLLWQSYDYKLTTVLTHDGGHC